MFKRYLTLWLVIMISSLWLVACNGESEETTASNQETTDSAQNEETTSDDIVQSGGELKIAVSAQPPTLDGHVSTAIVSMEISRNIFETLVALDENLSPQPLLAESVERSEDATTYTFHLRQGVKFHNGKELKAEDVVASMNRWLSRSPIKDIVEENAFKEVDEYTVTIELDEPMSDLLDILAGLGRGQYTPIMPKEVIESATAEGVTEYIGTGPYKFEEWKQDQYIHLTRFEDYQSPQGEPSGMVGHREAIVDDIYYYFVPDDSTRLAGIQTGEYDIADNMSFDSYEHLQSNPNLKLYTGSSGTHTLIYNKIEGVLADPKMRQAINAALNMEEIMQASFVNEDLYSLNPGFLSEDQTSWATRAGEESYNQQNPEKAKQLLEEAGYQGEEIKLMVTRDYDYHYNAAVVVQEQLTQAGFNVNLEVYDWATLIGNLDDTKKWDMFITGTAFVTSPSQLLILDPNFYGGTKHPKIDELKDAIRLSTSQEEAKAHWEELQAFLWNEYVPATVFGHHGRIVVAQDYVEGLRTFPGPIPWNTSVNK